MQKIIYKITTLSSLIVSPRSERAFYVETDDKQEQHKLEVIYPFYQYGEYTQYDKETADYYLPGSSMKGALSQKRRKPNKKSDAGVSDIDPRLMVDDIPIPKDAIVLNKLYKGQYLQSDKQTDFKTFMENIRVEMVKAGVELTGELYINERCSIEAMLKDANGSTHRKIGKMLKKLKELEKLKDPRDLEDLETPEKTENLEALQKRESFYSILNTVINNLSGFQSDDNVILMGGYKGLLHSIDYSNDNSNGNDGNHTNDGAPIGGIYVDQETMLPHGLVRIEPQ